ncbi:sensor histidine kinase [Solitalea koreensis]|uniref:histidine kinase n=1 Tax=Solitalea koreensis TaxID=543615 RepID=A0A521BRH1_9SPHI|nr:HAMP domain-containing sensor histidine kinase [Solitalea koreensis]SMO49768.1 Signal transduction histidine kinase [Solitalea koreensis]
MTKSILDKFKQRNVLIPLIIIILSSSSLIFINYFTIKILSAARAYVNGESHYSKGQKDASRYLITYMYTGDENQWNRFNEELNVPKADGMARLALISNGNTDTIKSGLRTGRNAESDLNDMIWLFKNFHSVSFLADAINQWEKGDHLINKLSLIALKAHQKISVQNFTINERALVLREINRITDELTILEQNFSDALGKGTRAIKEYLLFTNIFLILLIIGSVGFYYSIMINRLMQSKQEIEENNKNLLIVNQELDRFVYSASHDLRSPITSLKGLIKVVKLEDNLDKIRNYLNLMTQSLNKQDQFISDIIDYSRNKRKEINIEQVKLSEIIDESIAQHQYLNGADEITIKKDFQVDEIYTDTVRFKIILNNLLSNAIKYSDQTKEKKHIHIKTYNWGDSHKIEIADNGLGIKKEYQTSIFEMFFVTNNDKNGSGLGLYIAKEAVENLKGEITVESEKNIGSTFTITLPHNYQYTGN